MEKKRRTFWLVDAVTPRHRARALLLNEKGFDVQFFNSLDAVAAELETKRAAVIIVSDATDPKLTEKMLTTVMSLPETHGARLVLTVSQHVESVNQLAAAANVRDVIPFDIDDKQWTQRFVFATAGKSVPFVQPAGQVTFNNISQVSLPARLTWIGDGRLRLECRIRPPVGATLQLAGAFVKDLGLAHVTLTVEETQRDHLLYRFSDAILCSWSVPSVARDRATATLIALREQDTGPRCRVFVAARTTSLRNGVLQRFEDPRFEVSTALQKQSIVEEPKFFSPDVVFIEDQLVIDEGGSRFEAMLANLKPAATVVILGRVPDFAALTRNHAGHKLVLLPKLPKSIGQSILARYLPLDQRRRGAAGTDVAHLVSDHPFSLAEVSMPARLHRLHPLAAQIALPYPVSNFALLRLESPVLRKMTGRHPWVKLTQTYADTHPDAAAFPHLADGYLADVDAAERTAIAQHLTAVVVEAMQRYDASVTLLDGRTPELGSLKLPAAPRLAVVGSSAAVAAVAAALDSTQSGAPSAPPAATSSVSAATTTATAPAAPAASSNHPGSFVAQLNSGRASTPTRAARSIDNAAAPKIDHHTTDPAQRASFPFIDVASLKEARAEVVEGFKEGASNETFRMMIKYAAISGLVLGLIWFIAAVIAPHWGRSGGVYSDQLKKFAPHLDKSPETAEP